MSKISQDFINDLGHLYEQIHISDQDFLNEESEYYDEEVADLAEDIILSVSLSMFSEGYTAETVVKFLANSDELDILEKYLMSDVTTISEEIVHNEFVEEQFTILEAGGFLGLLARGAGAAVKAAKGTKNLIKKGVEKAASAGVERRIGKQFAKSPNINKTAQAVERLARSKASKAGIKVPTGNLSPKQATELIKQARISKAVKGVKDLAKGSLVAGTGVLAGYTGAKLAGSGEDSKPAAPQKSTTSASSDIKVPTIRLPNISLPSLTTSGGSGSSGGAAGGGDGSKGSSSGGASTAPKPASKKETSGETPMQKWARLHPNLATKVKPGQSGYEEISKMKDKPAPGEKKDQTPTTGNPEAKIDAASVKADIEKENERLKKKMEKETTKESYDIILEYLINYGHADTIEEANYIMLEMDESAVKNIIDDYNDTLLAEEVQEWVNSLLSEGYNLSEYSWDDLIEYYVTDVR
jgi:hypothetical protein